MKKLSLKRLSLLTEKGGDAYLDFISKLPVQGILFAFSLIALTNTIKKPEITIIGYVISSLLFLAFVLAFILNIRKFYYSCFLNLNRWIKKMNQLVAQRHDSKAKCLAIKIGLSIRRKPLECAEFLVVGLFVQITLPIVIVVGLHFASNIVANP